MSIWPFITNFGDAAVMLPCALLIGLWLALGSGLRALLLWFGLFALACLLTAATKIAFFGWGIGSRDLDFTGFSGHSMQAASVLPVLAWLLLGQSRLRPLAPWLGVAAAVLVAYSRVRLGYHSPSEAITGTLLGLAVAALCLRLLPAQILLPRRQTLALMASLLLPLVLLHGLRAPTPDLMQTLGTLAAGSDRPYTRADLHARTSPSIN